MDRVLLIDDDDAMRASLTQTLELEDMTVLQANSLTQARRAIRANFAGVVLTDIRMPLQDGFDVLTRVQEVDADLPVIFLTGEADVPMAVRALKSGAYDLLEKPCTTEDLLKSVRRALKHRTLALQTRTLERRLENSDVAAIHFPGATPHSSRLRGELRRVAELEVSVHLHGNAGVGKRLAAHTIHVLSTEDPESVAINFDDADSDTQLAALELPEGAYLIAKNVEAMRTQDCFQFSDKVGWRTDIRVLSTARNSLSELPKAVQNCLKERDPVEVLVPSLVERSPDLPVIFDSLVRQAARDLNTDMPTVSHATIEAIKNASWAGNLPELRSFARRCAVGLPADIEDVEPPGLSAQMDAFERQVLIETLRRNHGKAAAAARELKLARKTLYDRMSRHGIRPRDMRAQTD